MPDGSRALTRGTKIAIVVCWLLALAVTGVFSTMSFWGDVLRSSWETHLRTPAAVAPLYAAFEQQNLQEMIRLLDAGADPNQTVEGFWPIVRRVSESSVADAPEMIGALAAHGADLDAPPGGPDSALCRAALEGRIANIRALIDWGASVDGPDGKGWPLFTAVGNHSPEVVKVLLDAGADPAAYGESMLFRALQDREEVTARYLVDAGASVDDRGASEETPLMVAAGDGLPYSANLFIERGADVNARDKRGMTALMRAARSGSTEVLQLLLDHRADLNAQDGRGRTALSTAQCFERTAAAQLLESHHAIGPPVTRPDCTY